MTKLGHQLNGTHDVSDMARIKFYMPPVCFIVARSIGSNVIGCEGKLPWQLKTDLARFRSLTTRHAVIMGRKTYESIGRPLPNRLNIVVSRSLKSSDEIHDLHGTGTKLMHSKSAEDALFCSDIYTILNGSKKIFVIGGAEVYKRFSDRMDRVYLTEVHASVKGDAYFDQSFPETDWRISHDEFLSKSCVDQYDSRFLILERRTSAHRIRTFSEIAAKKRNNHVCMRNMSNSDAKMIESYAQAHLEKGIIGQMNFRFDGTKR